MVDKKILDKIVWDSWSKNKTADIKPSGLDFVMDTMPFKAIFKQSVQDEKPFIYEAEGKSISFKPTGMWWTTPQGNTATRAVTPSVGNLIDSKIQYPSALGTDIDIVLSTETTRWRKEIIIKSLQSLGAIPADAEYLEIGFEISTDFEIEGWDKQSELKFDRAIKLSELSQLESIKTWDNHVIPEPKEDEEPEDLFERCDGFFRVDGKYFLVKRIPADYLRDAVYPVTTDIEISYGSEYTFNGASTKYISVSGLDTTHFVVAYRDDGDLGHGKCKIGVVTGDVIAYGSEYEFNDVLTDWEMKVAALDATHFAICFRDGGGLSYGIARIGVVTGDAIAYGAEAEFNSADMYLGDCIGLDDTHFVVAFKDQGGVQSGIGRIGVVTGDAIAFGPKATYNIASTTEHRLARLDATHFAIAYRDQGGDGDGHAKIGVVTGNTIAYGAEAEFWNDNTSYIGLAALDTTHFATTWRDLGGTGIGMSRIGVVTGDAIAWGAPQNFDLVDFSVAYVSAYALDDTHFVVCWQGPSNYGTSKIGVVTGDTIEYGSPYTFNSANTQYISVGKMDDVHFVVGYRDNGGDDYGHAKIGSLPFTEKKSPGMAIRMMGAGLM